MARNLLKHDGNLTKIDGNDHRLIHDHAPGNKHRHLMEDVSNVMWT